MLLVYAMTRAATDGWALRRDARPARRRGRLLVLRSSRSSCARRAPLLPLRIFRLRSLTAANVAMAIVGAVAFSEFFLLTLYLQDVLHYTAMQSGVAFVAFALTVVVVVEPRAGHRRPDRHARRR